MGDRRHAVAAWRKQSSWVILKRGRAEPRPDRPIHHRRLCRHPRRVFPRGRDRRRGPILWAATGCDPDDPATWTRPVIRLGEFGQPPFARAVDNPVLHRPSTSWSARASWLPRRSLGTFPIRFPSDAEPGDDGWHIDVSFGCRDDAELFQLARQRPLEGQGAADAVPVLGRRRAMTRPTRIRVGSHRDVARQLAAAWRSRLKLLEID